MIRPKHLIKQVSQAIEGSAKSTRIPCRVHVDILPDVDDPAKLSDAWHVATRLASGFTVRSSRQSPRGKPAREQGQPRSVKSTPSNILY